MGCWIPSPSLKLPQKCLASFSTRFHKKFHRKFQLCGAGIISSRASIPCLAQPEHSQPCWDTNPHVQESKLLCLSTAMPRKTESWEESKAGSCVRREQSGTHKQEMVRFDSPKEGAEFRQPKPSLKHLRKRGKINTASVCPGKEREAFPKMISGVFRGIPYHSKFKASRVFIR